MTNEIKTKDLLIHASLHSISGHLFSTLSGLPQPFILESSGCEKNESGRFTLIGADPFMTIEATGK